MKYVSAGSFKYDRNAKIIPIRLFFFFPIRLLKKIIREDN